MTAQDNTEKSLQALHEKYLAEKSERGGNLAFGLSRKKIILDFFLLFIFGLFYSSIFPPLNFSSLAWFSIVPLYFLIKNRTPLSAFFRGWVWGFAWAVSSFFWLREIEIFIPFLIAPIMGLFPAVWCLAVPFFRKYLYFPEDVILKGHAEIESFRDKNERAFTWGARDMQLAILLAALWAFLEWVRTWFLTGFPWNLTAISQWRNTAVIQISDLTGAYGVSAIIILLNVSLCLTIEKWKYILRDGKYRRPFALYFALAVLMLSMAYGTRMIMQKNTSTAEGSRILRVAVIQGDIPQSRKAGGLEAEFALDKYLELSELALLSKPDIVVWPETAVPVPYRASHPTAIKYRFKISTLTKERQIPFLLGAIDFGDVPFEKRLPDEIPVHNSAILVDKTGEIVEKYHKMHLVPFGEYTPFGNHFSKLKEYFGMGRDLAPGKDYTIFELENGIPFGVNICYESVFPSISRKLVKKGADMIFVLTNDAWYPKSSEPEQHFVHSIFRAVENRRYIIRAGNNSCSSLISPLGFVVDSISYSKDAKTRAAIPDPTKKARGYAVFEVPLNQKDTNSFYTRYGDVFILLCSLFIVVSSFNAFWKWKNCGKFVLDSFNQPDPNK
jgi:apolipoprotein N-acyltransferase